MTKIAVPMGVTSLDGVLPGRVGLRFAVPGRWGVRDAVWSAGRKLIQAPSAQASDADRAYFPWYGGAIRKGVAGEVPIGGFDEASKDGGMLLEIAEVNPTADFDSWTERGTATLTGGQADPFGGSGAYLTNGLGANSVDQLIIPNVITGGTDLDKLSAGILIHPSGKIGTMGFANQRTGGRGAWNIDLSALSQDWHWITRDHAAVNVIIEYSIAPTGDAGFNIYANSGDCDCKVFWPNLLDSGRYTIGSPIAPAATRAVDVLKYAGGSTNVNANAGTIYLVWTPISPESGQLGQSGRANLLAFGNSVNDILYFPAGDQVFFFFTDSGGQKSTNIGGVTLTRGTKVIIAATWDGSQIIVYADSVGSTPTAAGAMADVGTTIQIGNRGGGGAPDRPADGTEELVHIFDYAHDAALIAANSTLLAAM